MEDVLPVVGAVGTANSNRGTRIHWMAGVESEHAQQKSKTCIKLNSVGPDLAFSFSFCSVKG